MKTTIPVAPITVLIPDGECVLALKVIQCLSQIKNISLVVLSNDRNIPLRFSNRIDHFYSYKLNNSYDKDCLKAVGDIILKEKIDIILPIGNVAIRLFAQQKYSFSRIINYGLLPAVDVFDVANDKWSFYKWLDKNKFHTPNTVLFDGTKSFKKSLQKLSFPVLAKPTKLTGGMGITLFNDSLSLEKFLADEYYKNTYIVQEYINGFNLGFNVLAKEGQIIAYTIQKPIIASAEEFQPSYGLEFFDDQDIYNSLKEVVSKLKWTGVANFDLRYNEESGQVMILEMNTRFWGNVVGSFKAGVNFPYLSCLVGLGYDIPEIELKRTTCVTGKSSYIYWLDRFRFKRKFPKFQYTSLSLDIYDPAPNCYTLIKKLNILSKTYK